MARENLVAGLTAAGVSIALLLVLGPAWRRGGESARAPLATGYPDAAGPTSAANGTDLRLEVHQLRKQLQQLAAQIGNTSRETVDPDSAELAVRVAKLETALKQLARERVAGQRQTGSDGFRDLSEHRNQSREMAALASSELAEQEFAMDSGMALDSFAESIEEVAHEVDGLDIKGMECGNSICRISYAESDVVATGEDSADPQWELMEKLLDRAQGRRVDIRHAVDAAGNRAMYIQLE